MGALRGLAFVSLANGQVVTISLKTLEIVSTIQVGTSLGGIVVDPYGEQRVYALDTNAVEALDPTATIIRYTLAVPPGTVGGAAFATTVYLGNGKYEYSGNHEIIITGPNGTSALNRTTYHVIDTLPGAVGTSVAISPPYFNEIYVTSSAASEVIVIGGRWSPCRRSALQRCGQLGNASIPAVQLGIENADFAQVAPSTGGAALWFYLEISHGVQGMQGCLVVTTAVELASTDAEIARHVRNSFRYRQQFLKALILAGQEDGSIAKDVNREGAAWLMLFLFQGLRVVGKTGATRKELSSVANAAMRILR